MKLIFSTLEYKNFRSIGNTPVKINLNSHRTTLISGTNGAGKTTVMSALCFALFGKGYGSINKPALINSINQKQLLVTVEFSIGKKKYKIIRGMKPNIFEIYENDKLKNQDPTTRDYQKILEQQILKFNYRAFTQVVLVGGGNDYIPFMRLSAKDRREFVEDLLDIRVFSVMNSLVKEQSKNLKDELHEISLKLKSSKEKIYLQESFIKKMKKEKTDSSDKILANIEALQNKNKELNVEFERLMELSKYYNSRVSEHSELDDKLTELRMNNKQIQQQIEKKKEKQISYEEMNNCPICYQGINDSHKNTIIVQYHNEISILNDDIIKICDDEHILRELMLSYETDLANYSKTFNEIEVLKREIFGNNTTIKNANAQISDIQNDTSNLKSEEDKLKEFAKEYISIDKKKKDKLKLQQYQESIQHILSDSGIKSKIIKQYIPTINRLINMRLSDFDLFLEMYFDENFTETFKSRHRDSFTYDNFSEGQKRRIDLAILLAWAEIAKAKNALNCNLLFLDEIDGPLDAYGTDLMHHILKSCPSDNIFIISHKSDQLSDKVDDMIEFEIKNNFTQVKV